MTTGKCHIKIRISSFISLANLGQLARTQPFLFSLGQDKHPLRDPGSIWQLSISGFPSGPCSTGCTTEVMRSCCCYSNSPSTCLPHSDPRHGPHCLLGKKPQQRHVELSRTFLYVPSTPPGWASMWQKTSVSDACLMCDPAGSGCIIFAIWLSTWDSFPEIPKTCSCFTKGRKSQTMILTF